VNGGAWAPDKARAVRQERFSMDMLIRSPRCGKRASALLVALALALLAACGSGAPAAPTVTAPSARTPVATATPLAFSPFATSGAASATVVVQPTPAPATRAAQPTAASPTRPTAPPATAAVAAPSQVSEGVHVTGADRWQAAGITGKGVKVGVIDSSFTDYKRYLAGANVTTRSFRDDGVIEDAQDPDGTHGTACAEIVHEMAPDAELYLAVEHGEGEFIAAVRWLTTAGVSIISYSNGWDGEYPQDGTSRVAQEVDRAKAAGIFFVVASGNAGSGKIGSHAYEGHYAATFADTDGDGFHDFAPQPGSKGTNGVEVRIRRGDSLFITMEWDDWASPHVNYSLLLYDANGKEVGREDEPISRTHRDPFQTLEGTYPAGTYTLRVKKERASDPDLAFGIFFEGAQFGQIVPAGSLSVPADARGAVAVGEADWEDDGVFITSAYGPTRDGRPKPELVAPACVTNQAIASTGDGSDFCGTSAAAPHVAGAAALYKQAFPTASPDAILAYLQAHADASSYGDLGPNVRGAGRLDLGPVPAAGR
jgi:subtilisin family serine protease